MHGPDAHVTKQLQRLILDHIRESADQNKLALVGFGKLGNHCSEAGILALREGRLDP